MKSRKNCTRYGNIQVEQLVGGEEVPRAIYEAEQEGYTFVDMVPQNGYFMILSRTETFKTDEERRKLEAQASGEEQEDMFDEKPSTKGKAPKNRKAQRGDATASR